MDLKTKIYSIIKKTLDDFGYRMVDININGHNRLTLEIIIEKLDMSAVSIQDCVKTNKEISALLDVEDPINKAYTLEISSPGVYRTLKTNEDFIRFKGEKIKLKTFCAFNNQTYFKGVIYSANESHVKVMMSNDNSLISFTYEQIKSAKLNPDLKYK